MASGNHFHPDFQLAATLSFTGTDLDTSTSSLRFNTKRGIVFYDFNPPTISDSPDYLNYLYVNKSTRYVYFHNGISWVQTIAAIDPSTLLNNSVAISKLNISAGAVGDVATIVNTVGGPEAEWAPPAAPYAIGANKTFLRSNGAVASFQTIPGSDIDSSATALVLPLLSNGSGGSSFGLLPYASLVAPSGPFKLLVSRSGTSFVADQINLIELRSDTDLAATHATSGYIPVANGTGGIAWASPTTVSSTAYETAVGSRVFLSAIGAITAGNYNTRIVDTISFTTQMPCAVECYLECVTAEFGYSIGDRINLAAVTDSTGAKAATIHLRQSGFSVIVTARFYGFYADTNAAPSGTSTLSSLTLGNWRMLACTNRL